MKYPLDQLTFNETITHIVSHANMQTVIIQKLTELLGQAMDYAPTADEEWYTDAETLIEDIRKLKTEHESRRWNENNFQNQLNAGVIKQEPKPSKAHKTGAVTVINPPVDQGHIVGLPTLQFDEQLNMQANKIEAGFGEELSEEDLAIHFNQKREKKQLSGPKKLKDMSLEDIREWEAKQDNATDVYKIKARVANLARGANASLTPQGEMLCNTYVHVLKSFYEFAEKIEDKTIKINLINLVRSNEGMPGTLIAAAGAGVNIKKT